jgi:cysteinyl-tRNA synthetase
MLKIYNSFTKKEEEFKPIVTPQVLLYVCGITVYDLCHIGHARIFLFFDVLVRCLKFLGYQVKYVRNITDIDDKIIKRANENHEPFQALTKRVIQLMHEDERALGLLKPDIEPQATQFIPQILAMIQTLIDKGFAYVGENHDVYFDISRFPAYGQLSHRDLKDLQVGARIEPSESKNDPLDFALWKAVKPDEPSWDSPWGKGRPGWHIECSAMSKHCLSSHIDIHGGGMDLLFPHHENEIAQSEATNGEKFVNTWMHVGFLQINHEKMSKSLGNFLTIRDVLKDYSAENLRYFMLSTHYRKPIEYSDEAMNQAKQSLTRLYLTLMLGEVSSDVESISNTVFETQFITAIEDDFNTPKALAVLFDLAHEINRVKTSEQPARVSSGIALLKKLGNVLGILQEDPAIFLKSINQSEAAITLDEKAIEALIVDRQKARQQKQWQEADRIRMLLKEDGILLEDQPNNKTIWRRQ